MAVPQDICYLESFHKMGIACFRHFFFYASFMLHDHDHDKFHILTYLQSKAQPTAHLVAYKAATLL